MEVLEKLFAGFKNNQILLLSKRGKALECYFLTEGIVRQTVSVKCQTLAHALLQESVNGIIEGAAYLNLKNNFQRFSLHVKANKLFQELSTLAHTENSQAERKLAVA